MKFYIRVPAENSLNAQLSQALTSAEISSATLQIKMRNKKAIFILFIIFGTLKSCLVPLALKYHYFVSSENIEKDNLKLRIFSTPRNKTYVVTNVDMTTQVFIKSPAFENPNEFYLMKNQDFFEKEAKQYEFVIRDGKFYRTADYKNITLKIVDKKIEKIIDYKIVDK